MTSASQAGPARRTVVATAAAAGLATALTACGSGDGSSDSVNSGSGTSADGSSGGGSTGGVLARTADIPEGGGKVFEDRGVVVTQPTTGTFRAFSSKCTHRGCAVGSVSGGAIVCPCHGSRFSIEDGSVRHGPATRALPPAKITVTGDQITLA
ncbi:Rieske (2Fe-2S) protein [Streptomyces sp. NK08204]|uniref:Rieske (2Fe-2S) protein n=1 Tax=Streptomyces sp. NK08204 TaxID=2873260 RepID=UPI001CEC862F|nr:Rieske (2Fe-2S) protein [Streptomyces sp. NK08204]